MNELFGAHAFYVWSSLAAVAVGIGLELWTLSQRGR